MIFPDLMQVKEKQFRLENYLDILTSSVFRHLNREIEENIGRENFRNLLRESIDEMGEYFDEERFIEILERKINDIGISDEDKRKIRQLIIMTDPQGNKSLRPNWRSALDDVFIKSPDKKGINYKDKIEDRDELRAWLYLVIKDEGLRRAFKNDFERALNQSEAIYFRFRHPLRSIVNLFRWVIGKEKPLGFKKGEFPKEIESYIEDLELGKNRITFYFEDKLLPNELRNVDPQRLRELGIEREGQRYRFSITPENLSDIISEFISVTTENIKGESELVILFKEVNDLYNDVRKKARDPNLKLAISKIGSFIYGMERVYLEAIKGKGLAGEEIKRMKNELEKIKETLLRIKSFIESGGEGKKNLKEKIKEFLKAAGLIGFTSFATMFVLIGLVAPLAITLKLDEYIQKQTKSFKGS